MQIDQPYANLHGKLRRLLKVARHAHHVAIGTNLEQGDFQEMAEHMSRTLAICKERDNRELLEAWIAIIRSKPNPAVVEDAPAYVKHDWNVATYLWKIYRFVDENERTTIT